MNESLQTQPRRPPPASRPALTAVPFLPASPDAAPPAATAPPQVNQHTLTDATKEDLDQVEAVIQAASGGTLVVLDGEASQLSRTWCLFEMWATLHHRGAEALRLLTPGVNMCEAAVWVDEWPMAGCGALVWKAVASSAQLLD